MEFYDNLNNNITEFFSSNQYNKLLVKNSDIEIISMFFEEKYDYSNDISKLIIEDKKLFLDIINRFRKIINESFIMLFSYEKIIGLINKPIIKNINTDKKIKFNRFEIIIKEYLFQINWFFIYYEELKPQLDWDKAVSQFNVLLEKKVNLSHEESLLIEFNELKKNIQKENLKSNNEYYIYAQNNDLELEPNIKYNLYWTNWYNFLGIDYNMYPTDIYTLIEICKTYNIYNKKIYYKNWHKYNLPSMPEE